LLKGDCYIDCLRTWLEVLKKINNDEAFLFFMNNTNVQFALVMLSIKILIISLILLHTRLKTKFVALQNSR